MRRRLLLAVVGVLLTATGCTSLQGTDGKQYVSGDGSTREIPVGSRTDPVDFSGDDLQGKPLSLKSMRGKPTVVSVWWSTCPPCRKEAPYLVGAERDFGKKVNFVGMDPRDTGTAAPLAFQENFGITWPSFFTPGGEAMLAFPGTLTPNSIPATVVLDAQGRVAASVIGGLPSQLTLVEMVKRVLRRG